MLYFTYKVQVQVIQMKMIIRFFYIQVQPLKINFIDLKKFKTRCKMELISSE